MTEGTRRLTRRELYDLVWKTPVDTLAKELGISGRGLGKLCERNSIPVPPRGYWARKAAGQRVKRPPLVELSDPERSDIPIDLTVRNAADSSQEADSVAAPDPYRELFDRQLAEIGSLEVPDQLRNPHPVIAGWLKQEDLERQQARSSPYGRRHFEPWFSSVLARRRLRILSTLFQELERRGCKIDKEGARYGDVTIHLGRDSVGFSVWERIREIRRRLTEQELSEQGHSNRKWTQIKEPTGELILKLSGYPPKGIPQPWKDEADRPLENQATELLAGILTALAHVRKQREDREAAERLRWEQEKERERREADRQAELARKLGLRQRAKAWKVAAYVRDYVAAVQRAAASGDIQVDPKDLENWIAWALAHADEVDPLLTGTALETALLWKDEPPARSSYGWSTSERSSGDPNWFWGQRWWLKG